MSKRSLSVYLLASLVAVGGLAAAAGCAKEDSAGPTGTASSGLTEAGLEAKTFFIERVYTAVKPACGNCHSGTGGGGSTFLGTDAETSYSRIEGGLGLISEPSRSPLINHIHQDRTIAVGPELRSILTQWLNIEGSARGLTGSIQAAATLSDAFKEFAKCMNYDIWNYYRMGDLPFTQTDLEGPCMGCHSTGQAGAWLSASSRETFEKSKDFPFIQKFVVGQVDADGRFLKLIPASRFVDKSNEACAPGKVDCHPRFGLPPGTENGVRGFIETTLSNLAGGTCAAGISVITTDAGGPDADGGKD